MKFYNPYLTPGETGISSVTDYFEARSWFEKLQPQKDALRLEIRQRKSEGKETDELYKKLDLLKEEDAKAFSEYLRRQPYVVVSRCPYCDTLIWQCVGVFSLINEFWFNESSDGRSSVLQESRRCPHLFCVDGALNLNEHQPAEAHPPVTKVTNDRIWMGAEVPFVKPRVLNLPTMVAVIHSFPVAEKYTAYPVVYFAEQQPKLSEFCMGWGKTEYVGHTGQHGPGGGAVVMIGKRSDSQEYELENWVRQGKLFWLGLEDEDYPLIRGPVEAFPYNNLSGRRHPYYIKEGQVYDLPDPVQSEPEIDMEY